jgi:hypothetical protein
MVMIAWLACVLLLLGRLVRSQLRLDARLQRLPAVDPASLSVDWRELCRLAGVAPTIRIVEDGSIAAPGVSGVVRPTIIIPPGIDSTLTPTQLRWVLLHELAHVRRRDLVVVALQRVASILLFFNPAIWVANRMIDRLREYACDDLATSLGRSSAFEAGEAFVRVLRHAGRTRRGLGGTLGVFGFDSRSSCLIRVRRLLDADRPIRTSLGPWSLGGLVLLAVVALPRVRAEVAPTPASPQQPAQEKVIPRNAVEDSRDFELCVVGPDGKPIPEALIEFWSDPATTADLIRRGTLVREARRGILAKADAEGKLGLSIPRDPERFNFSIQIPGFGPYWAGWVAEEHDPPIPDRFTAELEQAWSVGGIFVDPEGKPVPGVTVSPSIEFKKRPGDRHQLGSGARAVSDEAGLWRFDSVPESMGDVHVEIDYPKFSPVRRRLNRAEFGVDRAKEPAARISLDRGLTVTGHVTDEDGRPIAGALVRAKFFNEIRQATTGDDGAYLLAGCEAKPTRLVVSARGRATDMKELNIGPDLDQVDFRMKPGGTVRIRVLDHQGKPAAKARVFFQWWRGQFRYFEFDHVSQYADANGIWEWHEAPLDEFRANISPPGGDGMQLREQTLIARDQEYVFQLPAPLVISGRVFDAETKQPIRQFRVIPGNRETERFMGWRENEGFAVSDGRYQLRQGRGDFAHLIRIEADGYLTAISRDIKSNEGSVTVDFDLKRGTPVAAKVLTPDLQPASGARAALGVAGSQIQVKNGDFDHGGTFCQRVTADEAGLFQFPAQAKGFQLVITHPSGYAQIASTPEWGPTREIRLEPWARVEGTFQVGQAPAANVTLDLRVAGHDAFGKDEPRIFTSHEATTGPDGRFLFPRVIPGRGSISRNILFMVDEGAREVTSSSVVPAEFPAGKTTRFDLGGTGRAVVGKLQPSRDLDPKQVRWNFALVMVSPARPEPPVGVASIMATVARDGTFRLDDLPAGTYSMKVRFDRDDAGSLVDYRFRVPAPNENFGPVDLGTLKLGDAQR